jgi:hypothetical protein
MVGMVSDLPPPRRRSEAALRPQRHCLEIEQFSFGSPRANIGAMTNVLMDRRSRPTRRPFRTKRLVIAPQDHALIRFRRQPKMARDGAFYGVFSLDFSSRSLVGMVWRCLAEPRRSTAALRPYAHHFVIYYLYKFINFVPVPGLREGWGTTERDVSRGGSDPHNSNF